jgi:hypothetical protein
VHLHSVRRSGVEEQNLGHQLERQMSKEEVVEAKDKVFVEELVVEELTKKMDVNFFFVE